MQKLKDEICVVCKVLFKSTPVKHNNRGGKICPFGHFSTMYELATGRKVGPEVSGLEPPTVNLAPVKKPTTFRSLGLNRIDELEVVVQVLINSYEQLAKQVESHHVMSSLVTGMFEKKIELARQVLSK